MSNPHEHGSTSHIRFAFFLNLIFAIIELFGGVWINSLAIITDALHDFGDSLALGMAWYLQNLSQKGRDKTFSYGYRRFSPLGALINALILAVGSTLILTEAIPRITNPPEVIPEGMFVFGILGIGVNVWAYFKMHGGISLNEKVVSLHLLEDVLGWIAVLAGSIVIYTTGFYSLDPILSVLISIYILFNVGKNLYKSMRIFLQAVPESLDLVDIREKLKSFNQIQDIHDAHLWTMDGQYNVLTVHLVIADDFPYERIPQLKNEIRQYLRTKDIHHVTIELETKDEFCAMNEC